VAVLDVFHPGLAGSHLLVCRGQGDRSGLLVAPSIGGIAFVARLFAIVRATASRSIARACASPSLTGLRGNVIASRVVFS